MCRYRSYADHYRYIFDSWGWRNRFSIPNCQRYICNDRHTIITDISLTVGDGEIVSLIGANGAGKTTLVRALTKLNPASSGTILWNGEDITQYTADKLVNMGMIHVPEGRALFSRMTVKEN